MLHVVPSVTEVFQLHKKNDKRLHALMQNSDSSLEQTSYEY